MSGLVAEPVRMSPLLRLGVWASERVVGRRLLPSRLLAWSPRLAVGIGVMESLVVHHDPTVSDRILRLVRVTVSMTANCAFCIDMNSAGYERDGITDAELESLRTGGLAPTFTPRERAAVVYARLQTATPLLFPDDAREELKRHFGEREIVVLAATAAQVNFWTRLIQGLGIPPAGFMDVCPLPDSPGHQQEGLP